MPTTCESDEEERLLERAKEIIHQSCSWPTKCFLEDLIWFGWNPEDGARALQVSRMREIAQLYPPNI